MKVSEEAILHSSDIKLNARRVSIPPHCPADLYIYNVVLGSPPIISFPEDDHTLEMVFRLTFYIHGSDTVVTSLSEAKFVKSS